jgi:hypothetical protein
MAGLVPRLSGSARPVVKFKSFTTLTRRARACPGHPRRAEAANFESLSQRRGVDGRDKPGQDAERFYSPLILSRYGTIFAEPDSRGLFPANHAAPLQTTFEVGDGFWACGRMLRIRLEMPGTRPGKTCWGCESPNTATETCSPDSPALGGGRVKTLGGAWELPHRRRFSNLSFQRSPSLSSAPKP